MLKLARPLVYNDRIFPICLPRQNAEIDEGVECFVTGYGETKGTGGDGFLKDATVPVISSPRCGQMNAAIQRELTSNMICAGFQEGGTDSCQGDSGGPLVCRSQSNSQQFILQGVVSFGFGCASKNSPGIYAKTSSFVDWITVTFRSNRRRLARSVKTKLDKKNAKKFLKGQQTKRSNPFAEHFFYS